MAEANSSTQVRVSGGGSTNFQCILSHGLAAQAALSPRP